MVNAARIQREISTTHRSPNHTERRGSAHPDMIVLHYTGMETTMAAVERLCDPAAEVSAHYVVAPSGEIFGLVDEDRRAWHAGRSQWGSVTDVNSHSIGIEIANPGHHLGYPPFPEPQMAAVEWLIERAMQRWQIAPERVVGHACIAPGRKIDPGEKFDWARLAHQGLAVWLNPSPGAETTADPQAFSAAAKRMGYGVPDDADWSEALLAVWYAFAMRFLPGQANDPPDAAGVAHAERISKRWPEGPPARYLVLRVPSSGPPAVVGEPFDFATRSDAEARIEQIQQGARVVHHTYLDILEYRGDRLATLAKEGIIF